MTAESVSLSAQGLPLHALQRNRSGSPALLFLHGWLDHCHSFDWLGEALPSRFRQVAIDFRGMGLSGHLPPGAHYHVTDYLADVEGALDSLGLEAAHLVGHSLGGTVALLYAAGRPERVRSVTAIESLGPSGGEADRAVGRLRQFVADLAKPPRKRRYASVEEAAARVRESNSGLPEAAALHLARHGTREVEGGFEFTFDPAHRKKFGFAFSEAQLLALFGAVRCKVQVIHGLTGYTFDDAQMQARLERLGSPAPIGIPGGHHVHLERPAEVAGHLAAFVDSVESQDAKGRAVPER